MFFDLVCMWCFFFAHMMVTNNWVHNLTPCYSEIHVIKCVLARVPFFINIWETETWMRHTKPPKMEEFNGSTLDTVQSHSAAFCSNIQFECCVNFVFAPHFVLLCSSSVVLHLFWLIYLLNRFDWHFRVQIRHFFFFFWQKAITDRKRGTSLHMLIACIDKTPLYGDDEGNCECDDDTIEV